MVNKSGKETFRSVPMVWVPPLEGNTPNPVYDTNWDKLIEPESPVASDDKVDAVQEPDADGL